MPDTDTIELPPIEVDPPAVNGSTGTTILDRPVNVQPPARPAASLADGNPASNARGEFLGLVAPSAESVTAKEIEEVLARIAADTAAAEAAEAAAAAAAATAAGAGTAEGEAAPEEVVTGPIGWIIGGVAVVGVAGLAAWALHKKAQADAAKQKLAEDEKKLEELKKAESGGGGNNNNVKVTGHDPCDSGPYKDKDCPPEDEAHHIIADMVLRYGTRGSDTRAPNAPSLEDGPAICLSKSEHAEVHAKLREAFKALGNDATNGPVGTAPIKDIVDASIKAIEDVKPECRGRFEDVRKFYENIGQQPGRTTLRPAQPGSPAQNAVKNGGYGGSR